MNGIKVSLIALASLIAVTSSIPTNANDATTNTGNELVTLCNDNNNQAGNSLWSICIGYVTGVDDGLITGSLVLISDLFPKESAEQWGNRIHKYLKYCTPENATRQQKALVVSKYLKDHPEKLSDEDDVLVLGAFVAAWPCVTN